MTPNCGIHGTPMKLKPAGISKNGKSYPAFWTCGTKNPDGTWCDYKPPKTPQKTDVFKAGLDAELNDEKWAKINKNKEEGMAWGNAKTNATNLVIAFFNKGGVTVENFRPTLENIANYIYNLEPKKIELEDTGEEIEIDF